MRVKFYVAGNHRKGTVHVDVKQVFVRPKSSFWEILRSYLQGR